MDNFVVFAGTYQRSLDDKLRVLLPKRLRGVMPEGSRLFLTPGQDGCLELHTDGSLQDLAIKASQSSAGSKNIRAFSRLFYARAVECDVDKQGRIRIPATLAGLANIEKEIVFVGVGFHWELWNQEQWQSYLDENQGAFEQVSEAMLDGSDFETKGPSTRVTQPNTETHRVSPK